MSKSSWGLLLCVALCVPAVSSASDVGGWTSFRCPSTGRLLSIGATPYEVLSKCRVPEERLYSTELRTVRRSVSATEWRRFRALSFATTPSGTHVSYRALEPAPPPEDDTPRRRDERRVAVSETFTVEETRVVPIERWVFDFGPQRFIRKLVFEDGALVSIVDGDRGVLKPVASAR